MVGIIEYSCGEFTCIKAPRSLRKIEAALSLFNCINMEQKIAYLFFLLFSAQWIFLQRRSFVFEGLTRASKSSPRALCTLYRIPFSLPSASFFFYAVFSLNPNEFRVWIKQDSEILILISLTDDALTPFLIFIIIQQSRSHWLWNVAARILYVDISFLTSIIFCLKIPIENQEKIWIFFLSEEKIILNRRCVLETLKILKNTSKYVVSIKSCKMLGYHVNKHSSKI